MVPKVMMTENSLYTVRSTDLIYTRKGGDPRLLRNPDNLYNFNPHHRKGGDRNFAQQTAFYTVNKYQISLPFIKTSINLKTNSHKLKQKSLISRCESPRNFMFTYNSH